MKHFIVANLQEGMVPTEEGCAEMTGSTHEAKSFKQTQPPGTLAFS
ncbi:hypothetical protein T06_3602 [Trichinella sp. T6]|nr:hypothetical protein T06_3602 [Trichinella sp. T6]